MLSYEGLVVLAPMVRVGTLPMRLLALEYGADLVWSPETVDKKIIGCVRVHNRRLGTYDYVKDGRTLVLRTHPREKTRLVLQLGSADPDLALRAAQTVCEDVSGIDLNCGCPKRFSLQAGMGAALLRDPAKLAAILRRLVEGLPQLSVSAKIRVLPDRAATFELVRQISATGIRALTVHCRTPDERPRDPAHYELLQDIVRMCPFPVIANGDIFRREDIGAIRRETGAASVMLARAAQWNASVFRKEGLFDVRRVTRDYLVHCLTTDNAFNNTKYTVLQMWLDRPHSTRDFNQTLQHCKSMSDMCALFGVDIDADDLNGGDLYNQDQDQEHVCGSDRYSPGACEPATLCS